MEGGLCASFEKFVIDCEMLQQFAHYHQPVSVAEEDLALEAIRAVGPSGHFWARTTPGNDTRPRFTARSLRLEQFRKLGTGRRG